MYLMNSIHEDKQVGVYPYNSILTDKVQALKYTIAEVKKDNIIYKKGEKFNGHEFNYSKVLIKKYEKQKKELDMKLSAISKNKEYVQDSKLTSKELEETMKKILKFDTINEENKSLVFKLIDKIIIDDDKITIKYKFNNLEL